METEKKVITTSDITNIKEYETDPTVLLGYVDLKKYAGTEGKIVIPTFEGDLTYDLSTNSILAIDVLGGVYCPPNAKFFKNNNVEIEKTTEFTENTMNKINSIDASRTVFEKMGIKPEDVMPYTKNYAKIKAMQINLEDKEEGFVVETIYGAMNGKSEDFVVVTPEGQPEYVCAKDIFEKTYRPFISEDIEDELEEAAENEEENFEESGENAEDEFEETDSALVLMAHTKPEHHDENLAIHHDTHHIEHNHKLNDNIRDMHENHDNKKSDFEDEEF